MLNWIWLVFILLATVVGGLSGKLPEMTKGAFEIAEDAVMKIALPLIGLWAIWLGIMRLAEVSGLVQLLSRALRPIMRRLFPEVPPEHPAMGAMVLNMAANMLGVGNAATPLGLRAMAQLEKLNPHPGVATNAMCTFLALNTASIQLIPTSAISILAVAGSKNPTVIVPAAFLATVIAATSGVFAAKVMEKWRIFRPVPLAEGGPALKANAAPDAPEPEALPLAPPAITTKGRVVLGLYVAIFGLFFLMLAFPGAVQAAADALHTGWQVPAPPGDLTGKPVALRMLYALSILAVPFLITFFPLYAACRKVRVYEQFVEGAKEAFDVSVRVIPFLVAMLISISMLRTSGVLGLVTDKLKPLLNALQFPAELLPMVLMRPLSGSGTKGLFVELVNNPAIGPDSLIGRMAATIFGSTETTFYVLAVYFGSIAIRQTRHAVAVGLLADTVAVVASITICRLMFA